MKFLRSFLLLLCLGSLSFAYAAPSNLGPNADGYQSEGDFGPEDEDDVDPKVLRDFIETRPLVETKSKSGHLLISGDIRARWMNTHEWVNGQKVRGSGTNDAINTFKSEINLVLDYNADTSWVLTKIKFANFDGKDGGTATKVEMDRAFIGYEIYEDHDTEVFIEVGRSKLDNIFDSKIQYTSVFDGILLSYQDEFEHYGNFLIHGGPMIVDSYTNHYAWIVEAGLSHMLDTNFTFKYSFVKWNKSGATLNYGNLPYSGTFTIYDNPRYRFAISQILWGYEFPSIERLWCKRGWLYAGLAVNHEARGTFTTDGLPERTGWWVGFTLGRLLKAGDWSVDINYQSVGAQAVPEFDLAGIGHGNVLDTLLSDAIWLGLPASQARGFTNYRGWEITALYALTDNLSLKAKYQRSRPKTRIIGGDFLYYNFELAAIFAF